MNVLVLMLSAKCLQLQLIQNFATELETLADDIMDSQWTNKWQMSFNADKFSVMHIGHKTCKATITCPINSCRQHINSWI